MTSPGAHLPISAFIIAKDEQDRIGPAIESLCGLVDEIIVIDSGSRDDTVRVAEEMGCDVQFNEWEGYGQQKRFGEDQCKHDWVLNIDADERLTPELKDEIATLFHNGEPPADGYRIDVVEMYRHEKEPSRWAFAYDPVRLYRKSRGRFSDSPVHDSVIMEAGTTVHKLRGRMRHYSVRSLSHFIDKLNRYTDMQADAWDERKGKPGILRLIFEFPLMFFKAYILRRSAYLGFYGFAISMSYAYFRFIRLAKVREKDLPDHSKNMTNKEG